MPKSLVAHLAPVVIAYIRVSTEKQGASGLGLDAQKAAVEAYAASIGATIVKIYVEVETSTKAILDNRPELQKALAHAKRARATLVIAKLDRLARNVHFTSGLMESKVDFVCCDVPSATRLTIHILAAVAEDEARRIATRTKDALGVFKANGVVPKRIRDMYPAGVPDDIARQYAGRLGSRRPGAPQLTAEAQAKGRQQSARVNHEGAVAAYSDLRGFVEGLKADGLSLRQIAARLDSEGFSTRTGRPWNPVQVSRVLAYA